MKMVTEIFAVILVIGSIGAVAQGSEAKEVARCEKAVRSAVSSEELPAALESCLDAETRGYIKECGSNTQCIGEVATGQ